MISINNSMTASIKDSNSNLYIIERFSKMKMYLTHRIKTIGKVCLIIDDELTYIIEFTFKIINTIIKIHQRRFRSMCDCDRFLKIYTISAFWISCKFNIDTIDDIYAKDLQKIMNINYIEFIKAEIDILVLLNYKLYDYI
jgi:hypothetical protein